MRLMAKEVAPAIKEFAGTIGLVDAITRPPRQSKIQAETKRAPVSDKGPLKELGLLYETRLATQGALRWAKRPFFSRPDCARAAWPRRHNPREEEGKGWSDLFPTPPLANLNRDRVSGQDRRDLGTGR
jgi:hypothetical protein